MATQAPSSLKKPAASESWASSPLLRGPLKAFTIAALIVAALVGGTHWWVSDLQEKRTQLQWQRDDAVSRAAAAEEERRQLQNFQPRYEELQKQGFVGEENRLAWIEALSAIQQQRRLLPFQYTIEAQRVLETDPSIPLGEIRLHASGLNLRMPLVHEGDLYRLLVDLREQVFLVARACTIKREESTPTEGLPANLTAECELYIPSVALPVGAAGEDGQEGGTQ